MSHTAAEGPRRHRLTVEDYQRMGDAGILAPDARVELIDGEIIDMAPPGSLHAGTVNRLVRWLGEAVGNEAVLLVQNPVRLDRYSEPQPDLALARPRADFYTSAHPGPKDIVLIVEVADTSVRFDREVKVALYARHEIAEVWLIDLGSKVLVRHREPLRGAYARIDRPDLSTSLEVAALRTVRLNLGTLFA